MLIGMETSEMTKNSEETKVERVKGIEPSSQAWEAHVLPLNHTRIRNECLVNIHSNHLQGPAWS